MPKQEATLIQGKELERHFGLNIGKIDQWISNDGGMDIMKRLTTEDLQKHTFEQTLMIITQLQNRVSLL
jgi:galactokinase/mevalonate kinase-like predicted kinase